VNLIDIRLARFAPVSGGGRGRADQVVTPTRDRGRELGDGCAGGYGRENQAVPLVGFGDCEIGA
jgi:hypothetical protein